MFKNGVFEDLANSYPIGQYKNRPNIFSNVKTVLPKDVPSKMKELLNNYNSKKEIKLKDLAELHAKYELIHPFQDGNGRVGRIILYKECLKNDIIPFIIEDDRKQEYYDCLNKAQLKGIYDDLINFFKEEQEKYYNDIKDLVIEYK